MQKKFPFSQVRGLQSPELCLRVIHSSNSSPPEELQGDSHPPQEEGCNPTGSRRERSSSDLDLGQATPPASPSFKAAPGTLTAPSKSCAHKAKGGPVLTESLGWLKRSFSPRTCSSPGRSPDPAASSPMQSDQPPPTLISVPGHVESVVSQLSQHKHLSLPLLSLPSQDSSATPADWSEIHTGPMPSLPSKPV